MKKIKLNTDICPILNISTYNTLLEIPDSYIENDCEEIKQNGGEVPNDIWTSTVYNNELYRKDLANFALQHIVNHVNEMDDGSIPFKLKFYKETKFYSPKEYNFTGDGMDFFVQVPNKWYNNFVKFVNKENKWEEFKTHCNKFASCDGFISFYPIPTYWDTAKTFFEEMGEKEDYYLSLVLSFLIQIDYQSFCYDWMEECNSGDLQKYVSNEIVDALYNQYCR